MTNSSQYNLFCSFVVVVKPEKKMNWLGRKRDGKRDDSFIISIRYSNQVNTMMTSCYVVDVLNFWWLAFLSVMVLMGYYLVFFSFFRERRMHCGNGKKYVRNILKNWLGGEIGCYVKKWRIKKEEIMKKRKTRKKKKLQKKLTIKIMKKTELRKTKMKKYTNAKIEKKWGDVEEEMK